MWQWTLRFVARPVTFRRVVLPLVVISVILFTRSLWSNYIFDEQEALLANPYVNGDRFRFWQVFERDFWGLPHTRTIGSYRPLPNMIWRPLFHLKKHPWPPHFVNVLLHGVNAAVAASIAFDWLKSRRAAWLTGLSFVSAAVITEAVCGVVGLADVLSGLCILLALRSLSLSTRLQLPCAAVFMLLGMLAKESTIAAVPMLVWAALVSAPILHAERPQRFARTLLTLVGVIIAVGGTAYIRKRFFPVPLPEEYKVGLPLTESFPSRAAHEFFRWFQQPKLPADPINNPLVTAETPLRISGALRVYFRGLGQVLFPWRLSGDYSFPQEPAPTRMLSVESVLGGLLMVGPPLLAVGAFLRNAWLEYQARFRARYLPEGAAPVALVTPTMRTWMLVAIFALWVPFTFFPQSNIPLILPTVRAERFWYIPVLGTSFLIGWAMAYALLRTQRHRKLQWTIGLITAFFAFQGIRARMHANDYRDDLAFWRATARAVPNSAKAHLNYGVMLGARSKLDQRLIENGRALELAPQWPMANIYYGDTLCRLGRVAESWPHYKRGFELGPNDQGLIALALQCIWDTKALDTYKDELKALSEANKGSWLAYLVNDIIPNGEKNKGVDPKYRPRGYDGGPRSD
jgi:tetratricopeptide (TPR) repeat protein